MYLCTIITNFTCSVQSCTTHRFSYSHFARILYPLGLSVYLLSIHIVDYLEVQKEKSPIDAVYSGYHSAYISGI